MIASLATALLLSPAHGAAETSPPSPPPAPAASEAPAPPPVADSDIREFAAIAGRKVAGRPVSGPLGNADKILLLARDKGGYPTIALSTGFPTRQALPAPPPGTLAIVRLRQKAEAILPGPTRDDLAFAAEHRLPLFIIGEWARPAPMWEVAWVDGKTLYRSIGEVGEIGPWRE
ncbi:hypothetical protein [Sphingopyxis sp. MWB1]|uniref:hypothetical protein n=1 Tax=Sphingopyxis sp. MWB1 TaxID=1537715 RepID=UPI000B0220FF|nr:hypothetical protein [Sphingopyxis sp. MWB1]